jgi:TetR/AcrR family transcriptional regulator
MKRLRDAATTKKKILAAARKEFASKGYAGARVEGIARRAGVSKQLLAHHFKTKERLYSEVHAAVSLPSLQWEDDLPDDAADLIADRFHKRVQNIDYVRLLTWEAAGMRNRVLPGEAERKQRVALFARSIRMLQKGGRLPKALDPGMLQLAIVSLASYPLSFSHITRLITGYSGSDPKFQRQWEQFLRQLGALLSAAARR